MKNITVGYTIHDKAHLIPQIIEGLKKSFSPEDEFIFLFDNCTDNSEDEVIKKTHEIGNCVLSSSQGVDLFETRANNNVLKSFMELSKNNTVILFQDDIIVDDPKIKEKIFAIQDKIGDKLGLMGGRSGYELTTTQFPEVPVNKISNWEHKESQYEARLKGNLYYAKRTFLNRGPLVFSKQLIDKVGYLNEDYYPQWGDDLDYCARCKFKYGLENVVFQCDVISKPEWGTMRSKPNPLIKAAIKPNWNRFVKDWGKYINGNTS